MQSLNSYRDFEVTLPAIPPRLRNLQPETMAFLHVMGDFGIRIIGHGCEIIYSAVCEYLQHLEFFDRPEDFICRHLALIHRSTPEQVKRSVTYSVEALWNSCDEYKLMKIYFNDTDKRLPDSGDMVSALKIIGEMCRQKYEIYYEYRQ